MLVTDVKKIEKYMLDFKLPLTSDIACIQREGEREGNCFFYFFYFLYSFFVPGVVYMETTVIVIENLFEFNYLLFQNPGHELCYEYLQCFELKSCL